MGAVSAGAILGDRYELVERRASGASATVWAAHDDFLRRRVAVKVLHEHLAGDHALVDRFADEAHTAAGVSHPALVAVYDTIEDPPAIVLEWVDGPDLRQRLDDGRLSAEEAAAIGVALCDGLGALHERGLVHRDVKPANVLLTAGGIPKLTDFGIATANAGDRTATGVVLGTAKYLAPEQVRGDDLDGRTDLYALACVLYEALAGEPPFARNSDLATALARLEHDPIPLDRLRPDLPAHLVDAIMHGLARDPQRRWASAADFAAALSNPSAGIAPHDDTVAATYGPFDSNGGRPPPRPRRPWWPRILGFAILVAIAVLGWVLVTQDGTSDRGTNRPDEPLVVVAVATFDPEGTGPPGENDDLVGRAIDADTESGWPTERYDARDLGTKSGVGLILRLAEAHDVHAVTVVTAASRDWSAEIRVATLDPSEVAAASSPAAFGAVAGRGDGLERVDRIEVDEVSAVRGNVVLLWITDLGRGVTPIRVVVNDLTVS